MEQGDIYLVRFHPSVGSELKRFRPAVVVSGKVHTIDDRFALVAPLTTSTKSVHKNFELLVKNNSALEKDSVLLCWYLQAVDVGRLEKRLGGLKMADVTEMKKILKRLLE